MFERLAAAKIKEHLDFSPAVAILGARQIGKTTLAKQIALDSGTGRYLDLENPQTAAMLALPDAFLAANSHRLLVLDEIQNLPEMFSHLRGNIDADRRNGRFLILGSASFKLLKQSQSLAGRLTVVDMSPLLLSEVQTQHDDLHSLWLRGGFPGSYTASSNRASWAWRDAFVRHFLNTDLPALGINVNPELMRRFWRMLAHLQGQLFNASGTAASLGLTAPTTGRYLDHLCDSLVVRRLEPYFINIGKRLVKSPKVYVRDSGLLHLLLGTQSMDDLLSHPHAGASWEGFVVEQICSQLPSGASAFFYRTAAGAEMDVVVELGNMRLGFEIKLSPTPKVSKGFWQACADLQLPQAYVVAPVRQGWPLGEKGETRVDILPASGIAQVLGELG